LSKLADDQGVAYAPFGVTEIKLPTRAESSTRPHRLATLKFI